MYKFPAEVQEEEGDQQTTKEKYRDRKQKNNRNCQGGTYPCVSRENMY